MSSSSKKSVQSKPYNVEVNNHTDAKSELSDKHNNRPKKKKKRRRNSTLTVENQIQPLNEDIQVYIQTSVTETRIIYRSKCPCDIHYSKLLIEHRYNISADTLFDLIFGSNDFVRTYRLAQRLFDMRETEWTRNEETNILERTLFYKVPFETTLLGKSTIITREKQKRVHEVPGSHYVIETEVFNEGVKFSDTFFLIIRFCIVQLSQTTTNLLVTARIQYVKPVNVIMKQFIERSSYSASQDGLKDLNVRLNRLKLPLTNKYDLNNGQATTTESIANNHHEIDQQNAFPVNHSSSTITPTLVTYNNTDNYSNNSNTNVIIRSTQSSDNDKLTYILIFMVGMLSLIHLYLYNKLQRTDVLLDTLIRLLKK